MSNCEYCGEDHPFTAWRFFDGMDALLYHDCYRKLEDIIGYSHKIVVDQCPTCHHRHGISIVKYGPEDKGVVQCEWCHEWFSWTIEKEGHRFCDGCISRSQSEIMDHLRKVAGVSEDIECPSCGRQIMKRHKVLPSGFVQEIIECWFCNYENGREIVDKVAFKPQLKEGQTVL